MIFIYINYHFFFIIKCVFINDSFTSSPICTEQFEIENYNLIEETHCDEDM